jgi:hypothetical protein
MLVLPPMDNGRAFPSRSEVDNGTMITLTINGQEQNWDGDPSLPLLWYLRDEIGLTGTKFGCGKALCGACTVHVEGAAARSCITAMSDVAGQKIITIEGSTRTATTRCKRPGGRSTSRNVATVRPGRSCRRLHC